MSHKVSALLIKGTIVLTIFAFVSKALGALFKVSLTNLVGTQGMGIYGLLFPIFVFFEVLSSDGFAVGLTINVAKSKSEEQKSAYKRYAFRLIVISSILGGVMVLLLSPIFKIIQGGFVSLFLYIEVALCVVVVSILGFFKAVIRGYENFKLYSISEVLEDLSKIIFALLFAYLLRNGGVQKSIAGVFGGIILSGIFTILFLMIADKKYNSGKMLCVLNRAQKKEYIKFSSVMSVSSIVVPALQLIDSSLVIKLLTSSGLGVESATSLFGLSRGSVAALLNLPAFLLVSLEFLLLPTLSRSEEGNCEHKTKIGLVLAFFVTIPFTLIYLVFPSEIIGVLYGSSLSPAEIVVAIRLVRLGCVSMSFSALSSILVIALEAVNMPIVPLIASVVAGGVKIVFLILFVPHLSIYAVELSGVLFIFIEAVIILVYSHFKCGFSRPIEIVYVLLFWLVFVGIVYVWYGFLAGFMSVIVALVIAFISVITLFAVVIVLVIKMITKRKNKK